MCAQAVPNDHSHADQVPQSSSGRRLLIISPVRDEAAYLQRTIDSLVAQTQQPTSWIIVDDGSTDETPRIAAAAASAHTWIQVYRRGDRGDRHVGGGVIEAFNEGLNESDLEQFDYICKLDGDLELEPVYFERLFEKFEANPKLGTASGKCWLVTDEGFQLERTSDDFSLGAAKTYRRECFRQIGGFVTGIMWDGIDCHRCRMLGWEAASFPESELRIRHLRPMGSSYKSIYHGRLRWGYGQYFMGTHPLYALAITAYRMLERPWIIGGLLIGAGYVKAWVSGAPRYDDQAFRRHLRRWQLKRLRVPQWLIGQQSARE
jgi:glycosyltransferase involved in cell wall biosynthesis